MSNYGWICSRCSKSNAPHVNSCDCSPPYAGVYPYYPVQPYNPIQPYQPYNPGLPTWPWYGGSTITVSATPAATTILAQPQFDHGETVGSSAPMPTLADMYQEPIGYACVGMYQNNSTFMHNGT